MRTKSAELIEVVDAFHKKKAVSQDVGIVGEETQGEKENACESVKDEEKMVDHSYDE